MKLKSAAVALAVAGLCGSTDAPGTGEITVAEAWINAGPPTVAVNAGYFEIRNYSGHDVKITRVTSLRFERIEMHLSEMRDGMATMQRQDSLVIPAGGVLRFAPGGYHLMLFKPVPPLRLGEIVTLSVEFADGTELTAAATVRAPRDPAHRP